MRKKTSQELQMLSSLPLARSWIEILNCLKCQNVHKSSQVCRGYQPWHVLCNFLCHHVNVSVNIRYQLSLVFTKRIIKKVSNFQIVKTGISKCIVTTNSWSYVTRSCLSFNPKWKGHSVNKLQGRLRSCQTLTVWVTVTKSTHFRNSSSSTWREFWPSQFLIWWTMPWVTSMQRIS